MNRHTFYGFALCMAAVLGGFSPLPAQSLDETARREQVAKQELEQKIADLLKQAATHKDKKEALAYLEQASKLLQDGPSLGVTRKNELDNTIRARIKALKDGPSEPVIPPSSTGQGDDFQAQLNMVNQLRKQGRDPEARVLAEKLSQQYPNRREAIMSRETTGMAAQAQEQKKLQENKQKGQRAAMDDVDRSNEIPKKDFNFTKDPELAKRHRDRKPLFATVLTAEEKALLRLLDERLNMPIQFRDTPLEDVIKYLENNLGLPIQLSKSTLEEANLDYTKTITLNIPQGVATKKVLLMRLLGDLDLAYVIKNNQLVIMTAQRASKEMITKPYYVKDLQVRGFQLRQLADMIQSIEPGSWDNGGGPGKISIDEQNGVVWVTNTAEIISRIKGGLGM
jgi:hypothetical protein